MKKIVFACSFVGLLGLFGVLGIGCGGNACDKLADTASSKYSECGVEQPTVSGGSGTTVECTDTLAKQSECYTPCYANLDCIVLKDPTNPDAAEPAKAFSDCLAACAQ